jgi:hypothetical protein
MNALQLIACPCGKIKFLGDWRWNHVEFSDVISIIFETCGLKVGEIFTITIHYELCEDLWG